MSVQWRSGYTVAYTSQRGSARVMEGSAGGKGVTGPGEACTKGMGHSTVVKSQACLAESVLRSIPVISPCDLSAESVDFQAGTSDDAWVAEVTVRVCCGSRSYGVRT
jgi:hypothetical protein